MPWRKRWRSTAASSWIRPSTLAENWICLFNEPSGVTFAMIQETPTCRMIEHLEPDRTQVRAWQAGTVARSTLARQAGGGAAP